jgi:flagellar biosynthesis protein FliR
VTPTLGLGDGQTLQALVLDHAFGLVMVLARIGATFALMPALGEASIPAVVKAGTILTLTIVLLPIVEPDLPPRPENEAMLGIMLAGELLNGLWLGWIARVLVTSLPLAGQFIADFAGVSNVLLPNPEPGAQTTAISRLYEVAVPALILGSGLWSGLIAAMVGSYRLIPPGTTAWLPDGTARAVSVTAHSFDLAVRLAAPFILASVAWNVAVGLIARLVPRLQIFFVTLPGQIGLGLLLLAAVAVPIADVWIDSMRSGIALLPGGG